MRPPLATITTRFEITPNPTNQNPGTRTLSAKKPTISA